jgi:limonene-1,2-epoxide hydrolase
MQPLEIVERFFARWQISHEEFRESFRDTMHPECKWENVGVTTTIGPEAGLAFMDGFTDRIPFRTIRAEWISSAADGQRVYAERVDVLIDAAGNDLMRVPVLGVLYVRAGKIVEWRDYFDTANA